MRESIPATRVLRKLKEIELLVTRLGEKPREKGEYIRGIAKKSTTAIHLQQTTALQIFGWCLDVLTEPKKRTPGEEGAEGEKSHGACR